MSDPRAVTPPAAESTARGTTRSAARPDATPCARCSRPGAVCVCDRVVPLSTERRVVILQHPQEQDFALGTAGLVAASLDKAKLVVGLSWASLEHALGERRVDAKRWAVIFPQPKDKELPPPTDATHVLYDRHGGVVKAKQLAGIIVLDGSWSQAKTLWWRNAWLLKLKRMALYPTTPSIYGALRREPRTQFVSTLESVALALRAMGEDAEVELGLLRLFRTLAQRGRDAKKAGLKL